MKNIQSKDIIIFGIICILVGLISIILMLIYPTFNDIYPIGITPLAGLMWLILTIIIVLTGLIILIFSDESVLEKIFGIKN